MVAMSVLRDAALTSALDVLHAGSDARIAEMNSWYASRATATPPPREDEAVRVKAMSFSRYTRLTFQKSGPAASSFPTRLLRYAVGIWNWPRVTVGTCA